MSKRLNGILLMIMVLTMFLGANNFVFANDSGENGDTGDDEGTVSIKNCEAIPIRSTGGIIHEDHDFNLEITVLNGTSKDITLSKIEFSENNSFSPEKDNEQAKKLARHMHENGIYRGMLITLGDFKNNTKNFCHLNVIKCINGNQLLQMCKNTQGSGTLPLFERF
jgi:hypothetical protein